jgi:hypothetical protein
MRKLLSRRPSAGVVIGFIALSVALGGGAYAAKKKIEYKGLSKDARLKALPVSKTNANTSTTPCDPAAAGTFVDCTTVSVDGSTGFPRRYLVTFDGVFEGTGGAARGECRLELDNAALTGTKTPVSAPASPNTAGYGINIVTTPAGGKHTISVACDESTGDLKVQQFQLSAIQVR